MFLAHETVYPRCIGNRSPQEPPSSYTPRTHHANRYFPKYNPNPIYHPSFSIHAPPTIILDAHKKTKYKNTLTGRENDPTQTKQSPKSRVVHHTIEFDGNLHVVDKDGAYQPAAFDVLTPESPRCLCLGAAIRIHTGHVLGHDPFDTGETTESVSEIYTRVGRIETGGRKHDAVDFEPHLNGIIGWNDANERSYDDVRDLTGAVLRHLEARRW